MKTASFAAAVCAAALAALSTVAPADDDDRGRLPQNATFTTRAITPFAIEGLTGDDAGNRYTTGRQPNTAKNCPVWRFRPNDAGVPDGTRVTVGFIPNNPACNPSGITFDNFGNLYIADAARGGVVWRVTPDPKGCASDDSDVCGSSVPLAAAYATGVPGTNGLAFDRDGNLFTGDGTTGDGRVWKIAAGGGTCESSTPPSFVGCVEIFRIQAMANVVVVNNTSTVVNVGRDARSLPPGTIANPARTATPQLTSPPCPAGGAPCVLGSQPLVANGLAFTRDGDLYVADTARGAVWKVEFDRRGNLKSRTGCDTTFPPNTLCLENVFVAHPSLEGTDGIALDRGGNIWNAANERNAIVVVTRNRDVIEIFRNPVVAGLRNSADALPTAEANRHILEFPTSPFLSGKRFCVSQSDGDRRDNSPRAAGEVDAGGAVGRRGKISCMDQDLAIPGLPLPVH